MLPHTPTRATSSNPNHIHASETCVLLHCLLPGQAPPLPWGLSFLVCRRGLITAPPSTSWRGLRGERRAQGPTPKAASVTPSWGVRGDILNHEVLDPQEGCYSHNCHSLWVSFLDSHVEACGYCVSLSSSDKGRSALTSVCRNGFSVLHES